MLQNTPPDPGAAYEWYFCSLSSSLKTHFYNQKTKTALTKAYLKMHPRNIQQTPHCQFQQFTPFRTLTGDSFKAIGQFGGAS